MSAPFVRSPYNYDMNKVSDETGLFCADPSLAVQDQRDEVDINTIVRRFGIGEIPVQPLPEHYGDLSQVPRDFQGMLNAVQALEAPFHQLPADLRSRFGNDPARFVEFTQLESNRDEMERLGLLKPKEAPPPVVVSEVVTK